MLSGAVMTNTRRRPAIRLLAAGALTGLLALAPPAPAQPSRPDIVIVTVDTLRFDRLSIHGYRRPTTPHLDRLLAAGGHFTQAR